jgi:hypothetical protein
MKKFIFIIVLGAFTFLFNSCSAGYVDQEPVYIEVVRPPRPSNNFIWIEGGWIWSNRDRAYRQRDGYWARPNHRHPYTKGYWKKSPRGYHWVEGRR